jgi:hypothetical protein
MRQCLRRQEDTIMHALFRGVSVIPVLTIDRERDAVPLARALCDGGLAVIEVTLRTGAAVAAIAAIAREVPQAVVGAGTLQRAPMSPLRCMPAHGFLSARARPRSWRPRRWPPSCLICRGSPPRRRSWRRARSESA